MPVKEAKRVSGGTFCNLKALAGETTDDYGVLVCFRIVDWEDEDEPYSKGDYGWNMPFIYDAIVIHVEQDEDTGAISRGDVEVFARQSMKYGNNPMWVLRGHERPDAKLKRSELPRPEDEPGAETIGRIRLRGSKKPFIVLNAPSAAEKKIIMEVREELGGEEWGATAGDDPF